MLSSFIFLTFLALVHSYCPLNWVSDQTDPNKCYYFNSKKASWLSAEYECIKSGGHLASVSSSLSNQNMGQSGQTFWLGGTNQFTGGWSWSDGAKWSYTNWEKGQPIKSSNSLCLQSNNSQWASIDCNHKNAYVCELNLDWTEPCVSCDPGWSLSTITGKCYMHFNTSLGFSEARAQCQQLSADLVSVHSHLENTVIADLNNLMLPGRGVWTGLQCNNGDLINCTWVDGTPYDYQVFWDPYANAANGNVL